MPEEDVLELFGPPRAKSINVLNEPDWSYEDFSLRFGAAGEGVVEVGFYPTADVTLFGRDLFNDPSTFGQIIASKDDVFEDFGFIIIPSLGLTFTGFHDNHDEEKAVTVFVDGRWDDRKSEFIPYVVKG